MSSYTEELLIEIAELRDEAKLAWETAAQMEDRLGAAEKRVRELGTDAVTGLPTRLQCDEHIERAWARTQRARTRFGALLIDVDYLKRINDDEGHDAGDFALRRVAEAIRSSVRTADYVGRWGGDEFIVIVEEATPEGLSGAIERIVERVRYETPTTVSVGAGIESRFDDDNGETPATIIAAADRELLAIKRGR